MIENKKGVMARLHPSDNEMIEFYSRRNGAELVWCIVHVDMLDYTNSGLVRDDLENNGEFELRIVHA